MNLFRIQVFAPLALILGVFVKLSLPVLGVLFGMFLVALPFLHEIIVKFLFLFLLGSFRASFISDVPEFYTYKLSEFEAIIEDVKVRKHGSYLLINNLKKVHIAESIYEIDDAAILPKRAQMKLNEGVKCYAGEKVRIIGRFMLHMPSALPGHKTLKLPNGIIKEISVIKKSEKGFKGVLREKFDANLSHNSANIAKAIFLGDSFAIDEDVRIKFQKSGLAHLLGVSILNITIIAMLAYYIFRFFVLRFIFNIAFFVPLNILSRLISLIIVCLYCYAVGFEFPLLRSLLISFFALMGLYFGKNRNLEVLLYSAAIIIFVQPDAIYDIGFQLSFGAVLGLYGVHNIYLKNKVASFLAYSVLSSAFASIVLIPLSLYHFQTSSMQPFLANFIAIPYVSFVLTPLMLFFVLLTPLKYEFLIAKGLDYSFWLFEVFADYMQFFGCNVHLAPFHHSWLIAYLFCIFLFVFFKSNLRYIFLAFGFALLGIGVMRSPKMPFILVHPHAIGYFIGDKAYVYPKKNFITDIWQSAYNVQAICDEEVIYKESSKKLIINKQYGLIFENLRGDSIFNTKDFIVPYSLQQLGVVLIPCV